MSEQLEHADEDHFSKLPRDCLLSVFSRVDRETLDEAECLSKELQSVVTDRSLSKIKIDGELFIYEQRSGHSFSMNRSDKTFCLSYHTDKNRTTECGVRTRTNTLYDAYSYFPIIPNDDHKLRRDEIVPRGSATTVPAQIFKNLSILLNKHSCEQTTFNQVKVDQSFLDNMLQVGNQVPGKGKKYCFHKAQFDESFDAKKFADFLTNSNLISIEISNSAQDIPKLSQFLQSFAEDFLTQFAASVPSQIRPRFVLDVFFADNAHYDKSPHYWTPSAPFISIMCRFQDFTSDNMVLDTKIVAEIIKDCFAQDRKSNYQFSLTSALTREHLDPINVANEFCFIPGNGPQADMTAARNTIMKLGSSLCCIYWAYTKENGDHMVSLTFRTMGAEEEEDGEEDDYGDDEYGSDNYEEDDYDDDEDSVDYGSDEDEEA